MSDTHVQRPTSGEYPADFEGYVSLVPEGDILNVLRKQTEDVLTLIKSVPESRGGFRYAPEKWSIREVLGHVADGERIFAYRATCLARGEQSELPGFDENDYVRTANFDGWSLADLAEQFESLRRANIAVFKYLDDDGWSRSGIVNRYSITVPAIAWAMAGHVRHHLRILEERYGLQPR